MDCRQVLTLSLVETTVTEKMMTTKEKKELVRSRKTGRLAQGAAWAVGSLPTKNHLNQLDVVPIAGGLPASGSA